jgi:EmrB/QacA subfamily drug resistance transporter
VEKTRTRYSLAVTDVDPRVWRIGIVTVLGTVMSVLDTTIVNIAIDPLARALHADLSAISWVVTAYLLAIAAISPIAGWASRRVGTRRLYLLSLVLFTLGSLACGLAWDTSSLVVARIFQGAGGALLMPVGQSIIMTAAGRENLGRVMGTLGVPTVLAPVVGPTLGGFLLESFSWRAIFLINLPIGVLAFVLARRILPRDEGHPTYRLDLLGLVLGSAGLSLVTYGLSEVAARPTILRLAVVGPVIAGAVLLVSFVRHALGREHPLLDLRLFTAPGYALASTAVFVNGATSLGGLILLPLYLQGIRHESATTTGLLVAPTALGVVVLMRYAGRLTDQFGGGRVSTIGTVIVVLGTLPLAWIAPTSSYWFICSAMFVRGLGTALSGMPLMAAALTSIDQRKAADGTAQLFVLQRVGGSLGTALFIVILQRTTSFGTTYGAVVALTALSLLPVLALAASEKRTRSVDYARSSG